MAGLTGELCNTGGEEKSERICLARHGLPQVGEDTVFCSIAGQLNGTIVGRGAT